MNKTHLKALEPTSAKSTLPCHCDEKEYKKQLPKIGGNKKPNMEMVDGAKAVEPKKPQAKHVTVDLINKRCDVVKKIMKEKSLSMIEASKYVKLHNLYKKQ